MHKYTSYVNHTCNLNATKMQHKCKNMHRCIFKISSIFKPCHFWHIYASPTLLMLRWPQTVESLTRSGNLSWKCHGLGT